jgi:hypothetical protein
MRSKYLFIVGGIIIVGALFLWPIGSVVKAPVRVDSTTISVPIASTTLVIFDGTKNIFDGTVAATETSTVFSVLELAAASSGIALSYKNYPGMGYLVTKIGDKTNGADSAYWQYWVNNNYATQGADQHIVNPGDAILWKFTATQ